MASAVIVAAAGAAVALPVAVVGVRKPAALLAVYGVAVPLGSAIAIPVVPEAFGTLSNAVGLVVAVTLMVHLSASPRRATAIASALPAWLLLLGLAVVTLLWSVDRDATLRDLAVLGSLIASYLAASLLAMDRRGLALVDAGIVAGGAVAGAVALWQLATGSLATESGIPRFSLAGGGGEVGDPNITAATLLLPLAVGLTRVGSQGRRSARAAHAAGVGLTASGLLLTGSRGGLVSVVAVLAVLARNQGRGRRAVKYVLLPLIAVGLAFALVPTPIRERLAQPHSTGRTEIWRVGLTACEDHCMFGSGWGTFPAVHADTLMRQPGVSGRLLGFEAHNIWLQAVIELGVLGLVLLTAGLALTVRDLLRLSPASRATPLAALTGVLVANLFLSSLDFKYFWLVLIYAALTVAAYMPHSDRFTPQQG